VLFVSEISQAKISQGSEATCFRCGEIFNNQFIANLLQNVSVNFLNCSIIATDMEQSLRGFLTHVVYCTLLTLKT